VEQTAGQVEKTGYEQKSADTPRDQRYAAQPVVTAVRQFSTAAHYVTHTAVRHVALTAAHHVTLTAAHRVALAAAHHVALTAAHHVTLTAAQSHHVALTAYAVSLTVTAVLACIFLDGDIFIFISASIVAFDNDTEVLVTNSFFTGKNIAAGIVVTCPNVITSFSFTMVWTFTAFTVLIYSEAIFVIAAVAGFISVIVDGIRAAAAVVLHLFITYT
jgi:hypothetical protein